MAKNFSQATVPTGGVGDAAQAMLNRILQGAHECFELFGIDKTTMEDIARQTGVVRQTIYKHVTSKSEIIHCIAKNETIKINREVRRNLHKNSNFADALTETLFFVAKVGGKNVCVRYILGSVAYQNRPRENMSDVQDRQRDMWQNMLDVARANSELAEDISLDQVVYWLTICQTMLLFQSEHLPNEETDLKFLIRRFIVDPLLAEPTRPESHRPETGA